jgi:Ca2+/H+ antiporter, TMEM165/GDT1 family
VPLVHPLLAAIPAFLASLVEFVEALTIVLAVGAVSGWRSSLAGAVAGLAVLLVLVAGFGRSLADVPERTLQVVVGALLLLFGIRWLRKACLRAAGIIALHDEASAFTSTRDALRGAAHQDTFDWAAIATSFNGVVLEGVEVIFIVLALGTTTRAFAPAAAGAAAAFVVVAALGIVVHRPLARVPENLLKLTVGIMLTAFGTLWLGEALGVDWPGGDVVLLGLVAGYAAAAGIAIGAARWAGHDA